MMTEGKTMKHYRIRKSTNGWWSASVEKKNGSKVEYNYFFSKDEATSWCYGKIRYEYGRSTAEKEF